MTGGYIRLGEFGTFTCPTPSGSAPMCAYRKLRGVEFRAVILQLDGITCE